MTTHINIEISDKNGEIVGMFSIDLCKRTKEQFQLDPETFYRQYNDGKLHDQNIELMIKKTARFSIDDMVAKAAHVHQGNDEKSYVCYTPEVKTMDEAIKIAVFWSILTAFHMKYQADIGFFLSFHEWMKKRSANGRKLDSMDEFPLWIVTNREWKVEFDVSSELKTITEKYRQELLDILKVR